MHSAISLGPEVAKALTAGRPLVALESALISHGLPQPDNIACALAMEAEVRRGGATPATIALLGGRLTCGLSQE
ncbi:MAG: pseudouridine-5'-phosphate glycosidase, partial [Candidatus Promineifilaceae bacterium]